MPYSIAIGTAKLKWLKGTINSIKILNKKKNKSNCNYKSIRYC